MDERFLVGLDLEYTGDLISQYTSARNSGFTFITTNLFHPRSPTGPVDPEFHNLPATRSDLVFQKNNESIVRCIVGKISPRVDVESELNPVLTASETQLIKELNWAAHLGLPAVILNLTRPKNVNLSRILLNFISNEYIPIKIWITLPMMVESNLWMDKCAISANGDAPSHVSDAFASQRNHDPWHWWVHLSTLASDISDSLCLMLELPGNLPEEHVIARWLSEPVVCLLLRTDLFLTNAKGYPILPKSHQILLQRFFKLNVQVLISGSCRHDHGYVSYQKYIAWLWKNRAAPDVYDLQSKGLEDQLQEPLQPLRDNLSSTTYAVFEMDAYKYNAYEEAIYEALLHRTTGSSAACEHNFSGCAPPLNALNGECEALPQKSSFQSTPQIVTVLGAGRGPLVNATLMAAGRVGCAVRVYVVEKNPNALYTLQDRMVNEWHGLDVHLISGDMRQLHIPEQADIFVSELLGSFGDNELSPECLDGAQPYLKDGGVSIPCSYTSYLAPLQSMQFFNESKRPRDAAGYSRGVAPQESPYVVRLLNCQILAEPQEVFTFKHPKLDLNESNSRSAICKFTIPNDAVVHGLAGYFEANLFGSVMLSTHPTRHSPQMVSWFPFAFPLDRPVHVKAGEHVTVHMWRAVTSRHVWYEWALSEPHPSRIHNVAGHAYKMAL